MGSEGRAVGGSRHAGAAFSRVLLKLSGQALAGAGHMAIEPGAHA